MVFQHFGNENAPKVMLLHGGGLNWWNYREEAFLLADTYHVILPVIDGHAGSDRRFTAIGDNADALIRFIDDSLGGSVLLIGGLSLGGQILTEMLARRKDICRYALVESAAVIPDPVTNALTGPAFGASFGLIKNRTFSKLQFASLGIRKDLFEDYYRDTCLIGREDMIAFLKASTAYRLDSAIAGTKARVHVFAGEKEVGRILRSADEICRAVPGSRKTILKGMGHGGFSVNHPDMYARAVREILNGD